MVQNITMEDMMIESAETAEEVVEAIRQVWDAFYHVPDNDQALAMRIHAWELRILGV